MCKSFNWESYLTHVRRRQSLIDAREKKTKYMVVYLAAGLQELLRREIGVTLKKPYEVWLRVQKKHVKRMSLDYFRKVEKINGGYSHYQCFDVENGILYYEGTTRPYTFCLLFSYRFIYIDQTRRTPKKPTITPVALSQYEKNPQINIKALKSISFN